MLGLIHIDETKKELCDDEIKVPKRVVLPNGRTFIACYKRISRAELPPNTVMCRTYRQRAVPRGRRR